MPPLLFRSSTPANSPRSMRSRPSPKKKSGWQTKERADPPRLPARRAVVHAHPWHHDRGRAASGRSPCHHRVGTIAVRTGRSGTVNRAPPPCGPVQPVQAPRRHGAATRNPVVDVERSAINRDEGSTAAFSKAQAGQILDAPPPDTLASPLDRAMDLPSAPIPRNHRQPLAAHQIGHMGRPRNRATAVITPRISAKPFNRPIAE